jgi:trans-AT polyketide synthase, acyltransferase and oxidoreductase domains
MGEKLFDLFPEQVAIADAETGYSVANLCLRGPLNQLNLTPYMQTALFVVNALTFLNHLGETGRLPRLVAGHGVGEYNALLAAGVFDFQTGIRLIMQRAKLVARTSGGRLAVVIGLVPDQIREALARAGLDSIDIAILNSRHQTVISGPEQDLMLSRTILEQAGSQRFELLAVSGAFHSGGPGLNF